MVIVLIAGLILVLLVLIRSLIRLLRVIPKSNEDFRAFFFDPPAEK